MQGNVGVTGALCCHILVYFQSQQVTARQPTNILHLHENAISSSWPMINQKHSARKSQKVEFSNWAINLNRRGVCLSGLQNSPDNTSWQTAQWSLKGPASRMQHASLMTPISPSSCTPGPLRPEEKPGNTSQGFSEQCFRLRRSRKRKVTLFLTGITAAAETTRKGRTQRTKPRNNQGRILQLALATCPSR